MVDSVSVNQVAPDQNSTVSAASLQYLTFVMAGEEYGVDILCVQEIRGWENATPLPNSPDHIKGVINLRGTIVPLVDLRACFGMPSVEYNLLTVVIVIKIAAGNRERVVGIVVDAVSDVYTLAADEMKPAPDMGDSINTNFIKGLVNVNETMVILLDIDKLLLLDEISDEAMANAKKLQMMAAESEANKPETP